MSVINITSENFENEVKNSDKPVLLDFFAVWCGPCKMVSPIVDEIAEENPDIKVGKVDVDNELRLAQLFSVSSIPTLAVIKEGTLENIAVGFRSKEEILAMLGK